MIIWGTKLLRLRQGRVADFCPMCREVRAFGLVRTNSVSHLYFIPLGFGTTIAVTAVCESCGHEMERDPTVYRTLAPKRSKDDVTALVKQTFPDIAEAYAERLELEAELRKSSDGLAASVREELVREALVNVSGAVEQIYARTHLDWRFGLSLLGLLAVPLVTRSLAGTVSSNAQLESAVSTAAGVVACACFALSVWFAATANGRRLRSTVLPRLLTALRPLRPRESELDAMLKRFKVSGLKLGKKLRAREIAAAIDPMLVNQLGR
jgi:hypothetical protein